MGWLASAGPGIQKGRRRMTGTDRMERLKSGRLKRQAETLRVMIEMYCRAHHQGGSGPSHVCRDCEELTAYALKRLACCPFGQDKPTCDHCKVHCFRPEYKEKIRQAMAYAGPRLLLRHPIMSLDHLWIFLTVPPPDKPRNPARKTLAIKAEKEKE